MLIQNDEHIFICGKTGSGKTTLMKKLYAGLKAGTAVIIDVKHEIELKNAVIVRSISGIIPALNAKKNVIVRVENRQENYDQIASIVYARGNTILILDEAAEIIPVSYLTQPFRQLFTSGRSRKAVCWVLSQRPALISKTAISQSTHYFVFALTLNHDKKAICADIPIQVEDFDRLKPFQFFHFKQGDDKPKILS